MALEVKYDPSIEFEPIVTPIVTAGDIDTDVQEVKDDNSGGILQTKVQGVMTPLIKVNNIVVPFNSVIFFELSFSNNLPSIRLTINDEMDLSKALDGPKGDNIIRVQILPPFDNAYKKINLNFYTSDIRMSDGEVSLSGIYKNTDLYKYRLQAFGEITTYELVDKVAKGCGLGFASSLTKTDDKRYIYCANTNFLDLLSKEIEYSGDERSFPEVWVDWFNYVNLIDAYDAYNSKEAGNDIWIQSTVQPDVESTTSSGVMKFPARITNSPAFSSTPIFIPDYKVRGATANNIFDGTDKVLEVYEYSGCKGDSRLVQDGDVHSDVFVHSTYLGETFGKRNYLLQKQCRAAWAQKRSASLMEVELQYPCLGLNRGGWVDLDWYDTNDVLGGIKERIEGDTNTESGEEMTDEQGRKMDWTLNTQISGHYYIYDTRLRYDGGWKYLLTLCRPADVSNTYLTTLNKGK